MPHSSSEHITKIMLRAALICLALVFSMIGKPVLGQEQQVPLAVAEWPVLGEAENRLVVLRNRAAASGDELLSRRATEYRYKGMARDLSGSEFLDRYIEAFSEECPSGRFSRGESFEINGAIGGSVRLDCPTDEDGTSFTAFFSAWVEGPDIQTMMVIYRYSPSDEEVAAAIEYVQSSPLPIE